MWVRILPRFCLATLQEDLIVNEVLTLSWGEKENEKKEKDEGEERRKKKAEGGRGNAMDLEDPDN